MLDLHEPPRPPTSPPGGQSHVRALERGLVTITGQRKRERTRARLLWATALVLEAQGYDRARVADIAAAAGVSAGAFYVYFIDREDAARQFLVGFVEHVFATEVFAPSGGIRTLRQAILAELAFARANRGLLRALGQAVETSPDLGRRMAQRAAAWVRQAMASLGRTAEGDCDLGLQAALEAMICGAQRRLAEQRVTEAELKGLAEAMTQVWCAALAGPAVPCRLN